MSVFQTRSSASELDSDIVCNTGRHTTTQWHAFICGIACRFLQPTYPCALHTIWVLSQVVHRTAQYVVRHQPDSQKHCLRVLPIRAASQVRMSAQDITPSACYNEVMPSQQQA